MTPDITKLRALLEKATPGPWFDDEHMACDGSVVMSESTGFRVAHLPYTENVHNDAADSEYIAAVNPETMRALLDRLELAEGVCAAADAVRRYRTNTSPGQPALVDALDAWRNGREGSK